MVSDTWMAAWTLLINSIAIGTQLEVLSRMCLSLPEYNKIQYSVQM